MLTTLGTILAATYCTLSLLAVILCGLAPFDLIIKEWREKRRKGKQ